VTGDRYAGEFPRELFRKCGVTYTPAERSKSELYVELLPLINSRRVDLLDDRKAIAQLCGLERRTSRVGKDSIDHGPGAHDDRINSIARPPRSRSPGERSSRRDCRRSGARARSAPAAERQELACVVGASARSGFVRFSDAGEGEAACRNYVIAKLGGRRRDLYEDEELPATLSSGGSETILTIAGALHGSRRWRRVGLVTLRRKKGAVALAIWRSSCTICGDPSGRPRRRRTGRTRLRQ
jgi:hypothetical protein